MAMKKKKKGYRNGGKVKPKGMKNGGKVKGYTLGGKVKGGKSGGAQVKGLGFKGHF